MKIAIVYDYLPGAGGGAESVLLDIIRAYYPHCDLFLGAVIQTDWSTRYLQSIEKAFPATKVITGQKIKHFKSVQLRLFNYSMISNLQTFNLTNYDYIFCYTSFLSHTVITPPQAKKIIYMNTPSRMLWNLSHSEGSIKKLIPPGVFSIPKHGIRMHDVAAIETSHKIATISQASAERIHSFYNKSAKVIYPAVQNLLLPTVNVEKITYVSELGSYFIHVSRIESYKNIQLLIKTVAKYSYTDQKFIIVGDGPYLASLIKLAEKLNNTNSTHIVTPFSQRTWTKIKNIYFTGFLLEDEKNLLFTKANASFALNDEDFGLTKVESFKLGTPVIALAKGASRELVNSQNGILFSEDTEESVNNALLIFKTQTFNKEEIIQTANQFSFENFKDQLQLLLE
jgi:glycosyltransferase involved in cell wall biosynthesis